MPLSSWTRYIRAGKKPGVWHCLYDYGALYMITVEIIEKPTEAILNHSLVVYVARTPFNIQ